MATKVRFPAKDIATKVRELMAENPLYTNNIWRATNHVLKENGLPSIQRLTDLEYESLNKALIYGLEGN